MTILLYILLIIICVIVRRKRGAIGEWKVARRLERLPEDRYRVLNDVMLKTRNGHTTQIDHVVVSIYGIFVIETKNYSGWITGGEDSEYWTKNVYGNKYQFRNPILQNNSHARAVRNVISEIGMFPIVPIVAFSWRSTLKVNVRSHAVIYWKYIIDEIAKYSEVVLSPQQMMDVAAILSEKNDVSKEGRKAHVAYVRSTASQSEKKIRDGVCPRCGGTLVERHGTYGRFYGCSNYPKCRFTMNK